MCQIVWHRFVCGHHEVRPGLEFCEKVTKLHERPCEPEYRESRLAQQSVDCLECVFSGVVDEKLFNSQLPERSYTPDGYPRWLSLESSDETMNANTQEVEKTNANEIESENDTTEVDTDEMRELEKLEKSHSGQINSDEIQSLIDDSEAQGQSISTPAALVISSEADARIPQTPPVQLKGEPNDKNIWTRSKERATVYTAPTTRNKRKLEATPTISKATKRQR
jgi:hypothetical protein